MTKFTIDSITIEWTEDTHGNAYMEHHGEGIENQNELISESAKVALCADIWVETKYSDILVESIGVECSANGISVNYDDAERVAYEIFKNTNEAVDTDSIQMDLEETIAQYILDNN